jgi:hypothetical protein
VLFEREKAMIWANAIIGSSSGEFQSYLFGRKDIFSNGSTKFVPPPYRHDARVTSI